MPSGARCDRTPTSVHRASTVDPGVEPVRDHIVELAELADREVAHVSDPKVDVVQAERFDGVAPPLDRRGARSMPTRLAARQRVPDPDRVLALATTELEDAAAVGAAERSTPCNSATVESWSGWLGKCEKLRVRNVVVGRRSRVTVLKLVRSEKWWRCTECAGCRDRPVVSPGLDRGIYSRSGDHGGNDRRTAEYMRSPIWTRHCARCSSANSSGRGSTGSRSHSTLPRAIGRAS